MINKQQSQSTDDQLCRAQHLVMLKFASHRHEFDGTLLIVWRPAPKVASSSEPS
jgi:hypothetical protein